MPGSSVQPIRRDLEKRGVADIDVPAIVLGFTEEDHSSKVTMPVTETTTKRGK